MARYVLTDAGLVSRETGEPLVIPPGPVAMPYITSDLPAYRSPVTGKMVDGRYDRREDLKRSGCREVDPGELQVRYRNKTRAIKAKREHDPDANRQAMKYTGFLA